MDIKALLKEYKVFVDTSSWMYPPANQYIKEELSGKINADEPLIISRKVAEEINKHLGNKEESTQKRAAAASDLLNGLLKQQKVNVFGEENDPFADQTFLYVFQRFRGKYNLALITQDRKLAEDIQAMDKQKSVLSNKKILALRVNAKGKLHRWDFQEEGNNTTTTAGKKIQKFPVGKRVRQLEDEQLQADVLPKTGESIHTRRFGQLLLKEEIGSGGEGAVYKTDQDYVCKIYTAEALKKSKLEKLQLMSTIPIDMAGICWPVDLAYNEDNQFVGYLMPAAEGKPMQTSMMQKPVLKKNFPHWNRRHLVELALTILKKMQYLHERNIIIGDINPLNILVKSEKEVYFVDTDSYQVGDFPCPVGTPTFTPPEIQGKNYATFLRTANHENFAVATMLFMILLPGKPPYAQQGGTTALENIKNSIFPYPFGDDSTGTAPDGPWRYIWSHLPYKTKQAFYQTFMENKRISVKEWIGILSHYQSLFAREHTTLELFPADHKIPEGQEAEMVCIKCGNIHAVHINMKKELEEKGKGSHCVSCREQYKLIKLMQKQQKLDGQAMKPRQSSTGSPVRRRRVQATNQWQQSPRTVAQQTGTTNQWRYRSHRNPRPPAPAPVSQPKSGWTGFIKKLFVKN